jgi:hypothetical protein
MPNQKIVIKGLDRLYKLKYVWLENNSFSNPSDNLIYNEKKEPNDIFYRPNLKILFQLF